LKRSGWFALSCVVLILLAGGCGGSGTGSNFNPTPVPQTLFPSNVTAGSDSFTMFVAGTGFLSGSKGVTFAYWNGTPLSSVFNNTTNQLAVQVPASFVATPNTANVTLFNPPPGGGRSSNGVDFTIIQPQPGWPAIASFSPTSAASRGAAFTLTVNGSNFTTNDVVTWNGSFRTTTFVNTNQVTAAITANDIATSGTGSVSVVDSIDPTTASLTLSYAITGGNNPMPVADSISPASTSKGGSDFELTINGSGFVSNSVAEWGGMPLATSFLSGSRLIALVPAGDITSSGSVQITVTTPAPGGGTSTGNVSFTIN
jgi:hypothetical protein